MHLVRFDATKMALGTEEHPRSSSSLAGGGGGGGGGDGTVHPFECAYAALSELASKHARKHAQLIESIATRREKIDDIFCAKNKSGGNEDADVSDDDAYEKRTEDLTFFLEPIEMALGSKHAGMEEKAVICLTSLIGGRWITGRCYEDDDDSDDEDETNPDEKDDDGNEKKQTKTIQQRQQKTKRELLCAKVVKMLAFACGESGDESVELQALLGVLACYMSRSFRVSRKMSSRMIESVCKCHASSRSETNRGIAKAVLIQMIFANFSRVEEGDSRAFSKMIKVSDVLGGGLKEGGSNGTTGATPQKKRCERLYKLTIHVVRNARHARELLRADV